MSTLADLREARVGVWAAMPEDVAALAHRRQIMQPAGVILYAEAEIRGLTELLWVFHDSLERGDLEEVACRAMLGRILEHYAERLGGWYCLPAAASFALAAKQVMKGTEGDELLGTLQEIMLYMSRISLWLDLLIPWNDVNELMRALDAEEGVEM
jgi:hypothetical protein